MPSLDILLLRSFVAVSRTGSISNAALQVGRTQSAVSMQMRRLETAVGQPILHRTGTGVALTATGDRLLSYAEKIRERPRRGRGGPVRRRAAGLDQLRLPGGLSDRLPARSAQGLHRAPQRGRDRGRLRSDGGAAATSASASDRAGIGVAAQGIPRPAGSSAWSPSSGWPTRPRPRSSRAMSCHWPLRPRRRWITARPAMRWNGPGALSDRVRKQQPRGAAGGRAVGTGDQRHHPLGRARRSSRARGADAGPARHRNQSGLCLDPAFGAGSGLWRVRGDKSSPEGE